MSRLRIYTAGTGTLQYDSADTESGENPIVSKEYSYGTNFTINTNNNEVHCYFNASRKAPEQFIAIYQREGQIENYERLLVECKKEIESTIDELGWHLLNDNPGQEWFLSLDSEGTNRLDKDLKDIGKIASKPYEFDVSSPKKGIDFVLYLLASGVEGHIAVGKDNPLDVHKDLDVAISVDESVSTVQPAGDTLQKIQQYALEQLKSNAGQSIDDLINITKDRNLREGQSKQIVRSLNNAGSKDMGVVFQYTKGNNREKIRQLIKYAFAGFGVSLLLGIVGMVALGWTSTISDLLFSNYTPSELGLDVLPVTDSGIGSRIFNFALPSIAIILITAMLFLLHISNSISIYANRIISFLVPGSETVADKIQRQAKKVVSNIKDIREHPLVDETDDLTQQLNKDVFYDKRIFVRARSLVEVQKELKKVQIVGVGFGLLIALSLGLVGYLSANILIEQWEVALLTMILLSLLMLAVFIIRFLMIFGGVLVRIGSKIILSKKKSGPINRSTKQKTKSDSERQNTSNNRQRPFGGGSEKNTMSGPNEQTDSPKQSKNKSSISPSADLQSTDNGSDYMVRERLSSRPKSRKKRRFFRVLALLIAVFLIIIAIYIIFLQ